MKLLTRRAVLVDMGQTYLAEPDADGLLAALQRPLAHRSIV
jgi:hypothetical protein